MRRICIGHGMKMYLDRQQTKSWTEQVVQGLKKESPGVETFFFPQFLFLGDVQQIIGQGLPGYGGQNMGSVAKGAYTGEVSALALIQLGCKYVEVGHSERRTYFNEQDFFVNQKVQLALEAGLRPVICIGEDVEDLEVAKNFLIKQVPTVLAGLKLPQIPEVILAYEPRWAIGQDQSADVGYIQEAHYSIRACLQEQYGDVIAQETRIIYGGSVDLQSGSTILAQPDVDGLFVGRAALDPKSFLKFVKMGEK